MTLPDIVAILAAEPFNRSMEEIKRLTLFQVDRVLLRPRDPRGAVVLDPPPIDYSLSDSQRLATWCAVYKCPEWWAREKYGS